MKPPSVKRAGELLAEFQAQGVVVIAIGQVNFAVVSYGKTKRKCRQMEDLVNDLTALIESGELDVA
jgi:hypothetical protein